ncbi:hypothetical protein [Methylomonas sp. AM2-LC]
MFKNIIDYGIMFTGVIAVLVLATFFLGSELWFFSKQGLQKVTRVSG